MVAPNDSSVLPPVVDLDCLLRLLLGMNIPKHRCLLSAVWALHLVLLKLKVFSVCIYRAELRKTFLIWGAMIHPYHRIVES